MIKNKTIRLTQKELRGFFHRLWWNGYQSNTDCEDICHENYPDCVSCKRDKSKMEDIIEEAFSKSKAESEIVKDLNEQLEDKQLIIDKLTSIISGALDSAQVRGLLGKSQQAADEWRKECEEMKNRMNEETVDAPSS